MLVLVQLQWPQMMGGPGPGLWHLQTHIPNFVLPFWTACFPWIETLLYGQLRNQLPAPAECSKHWPRFFTESAPRLIMSFKKGATERLRKNVRYCAIFVFLNKKSCIRETPTLSTDANRRTDTNWRGCVINLFKKMMSEKFGGSPKFFFGGGVISPPPFF